MVKQIFSFGKGQKHKGCYVVIEGKDREACREEMIKRFGMNWAYRREYYMLSRYIKAGSKRIEYDTESRTTQNRKR